MTGIPERTGLSFHPGTPAFLTRAYGISYERMENGMPLYRDGNGNYFWGGWGSFYTVCMGDDVSVLQSEADSLGRAYGIVEGCFSLQKDFFSARHVHVMLAVPEGTREEDRMSLYTKIARNQTKRAREAPFTLSIERGSIPPGWYGEYRNTMRRLGSAPKHEDHFGVLRDCFGDSLYCVLARDGDTIVGSTMYIRHGDYVHLLSNVSRQSHWHLRVNNLVYDEMIRQCIVDGVRYIDFGLTGARASSLLAFKEGFGGKRWYIATRTFGSPARRLFGFAMRAKRALMRRVS